MKKIKPKNKRVSQVLTNHTYFPLAEIGDFDFETHTAAFVSEFRFVSNQNEQFEIDVLETFKKLR